MKKFFLLTACLIACLGLNAQETKVAIASATATSYQNGEDASRAIDGKTSTLWHSSYQGTSFPVTFTLAFENSTYVDYVRYVPRVDGSTNGHWNEVTVAYCSTKTGSSFENLGSYTLNGEGSVFDFPIGKTCGQVKFTINSGRGGWASASEITAYAYDTEKIAAFEQYFDDALYSQLKSNVTSSNGIADSDVKALVDAMLADPDGYKKFRVGEYEPYMTLASAKKRVGNKNPYSKYENPTGIYLKEGESCIVAVSGLGTDPVKLKIKNWVENTNVSSYPLHNGLNYITATSTGNVFVDYYTDNEEAENVEVHFINAPVLGYWDAGTMTNDDWKALLNGKSKDDNTILMVQSEHVQLAYPISAWLAYCPEKVSELMALYEEVQWAQRDIMGLIKFGKEVENRQFFYATTNESYSFWYAFQ